MNNKQKVFVSKFSWAYAALSMVGILGGFALAFMFDMVILRDCFGVIAHVNPVEAAKLALAIALIADSFALAWGWENAKKCSGEKIESLLWIIMWVLGGVAYVVLEICSIFSNGSMENIDFYKLINDFLTLLLSYIGSGFAISRGVEYLMNYNRLMLWSSKRKYNNMCEKFRDKISEIEEKILKLESMTDAEAGFAESYNVQLKNIQDHEIASMNGIANRILQNEADMEPSTVHQIMNEVLAGHIEKYKD